MTRERKLAAFRSLHDKGTFVMPNPWDAGTARILTALGFPALATTSAGYAFSAGKRDSEAALTRAEVLTNAAAIAAASDLPLSGDLEEGFGPAPGDCAETIRQAAEAGLVGGSIEDATGDPAAPLFSPEAAAERIAASAETARSVGFVLTARAENFITGNPDLVDTIDRLQLYSDAGADVLYAPGLPDIDAIRTVCLQVDKPVNVLMGLSGPAYTVEALAEAGVRRISVGGSLARAALGEMIRAAEEVRDHGSFTYAARAAPDRTIRRFMDHGKRN